MQEGLKEKLSETSEKAALVAKELERLEDIFSNIEDENKREFVQRQIENLAWYAISIKELQKRVDEYGTMIRYDNGGGQSGLRQNPDCKTLLAYQKNMNAITSALVDLVPKKAKSKDMAGRFGDLLG